MLQIKTVDAELIKDGTSFLVSDNKLTGTSLEVLSFMSSGIKKRTGSEYSDGRPGRINYHSEDEYRTITLLVQSTAYDMQDVAHLRDAVNELFDGELMLREMRIKSVEVEYESMGQRTGEMQLGAPEYVNGKQIKVTMVNSPEIDDTALVSTFTVEFETTELLYFETIYTTLELHDSGYSAIAEKYGLVDNIDDEKVKYRFDDDKETLQTMDLSNLNYIYGFISGTGAVSQIGTGSYTLNDGFIDVVKGATYRFIDRGSHPRINYWWLYMYNDDETFIERIALNAVGNGREHTFTAKGTKLKLMINPVTPISENRIDVSRIGVDILPQLERLGKTNFSVYNAGNVTVEPESMYLNIFATYVTSAGDFTIRNKTTGDEFILRRESNGSHVRLNGMVVSMGSFTNIFRDTNKRFISLVPGDNQFEILNGTFEEIRFEFKYLYK